MSVIIMNPMTISKLSNIHASFVHTVIIVHCTKLDTPYASLTAQVDRETENLLYRRFVVSKHDKNKTKSTYLILLRSLWTDVHIWLPSQLLPSIEVQILDVETWQDSLCWQGQLTHNLSKSRSNKVGHNCTNKPHKHSRKLLYDRICEMMK